MDYEKKYKESMAKMSTFLAKHDGFTISKDGEMYKELSEIFDELKESEDEKTKRLLHTIANKMSQHLRDIFTEEEFQCFDAWSNAWLEKQGEKPNNVYDKELSEILCRVIRRYINDPNIPYTEREKVSMEIISYVERLEKQGEQKPNYCHHEVDLSRCSEEYRKAYYDGWNNCNMQHSQCKSELDDVVSRIIFVINSRKHIFYTVFPEDTWE